MADRTQIRMTAAEFKQLPESSEHIELIYGETIVSPTPKFVHQKLVFLIAKLVESLTSKGTVVLSPMDVYLDDENVVQSDIFWVSGPESNCQLGDDDYWHGAPDLVVEIASPSTARLDRTVKFDLYEKFGVREYWLVDPLAQYFEVWKLGAGKFQRGGAFGPSDKFESAVLSQTVDMAAVFS